MWRDNKQLNINDDDRNKIIKMMRVKMVMIIKVMIMLIKWIGKETVREREWWESILIQIRMCEMGIDSEIECGYLIKDRVSGNIFACNDSNKSTVVILLHQVSFQFFGKNW